LAPLGGLIYVYFSIVLIYSLISSVSNGLECRQATWLLFSASKLVLAQLFLLAAYYLLS
jgi:hypothetical protein